MINLTEKQRFSKEDTILDGHELRRQCSSLKTYSILLMRRDVMKLRASLDMVAKASSSKSSSARVMFANVSTSFSPMNGESPDNLGKKKNWLLEETF